MDPWAEPWEAQEGGEGSHREKKPPQEAEDPQGHPEEVHTLGSLRKVLAVQMVDTPGGGRNHLPALVSAVHLKKGWAQTEAQKEALMEALWVLQPRTQTGVRK